MAEKQLKSIKFHGLNTTYVIPEVDPTSSVSGDAADAKVVGDHINNKNNPHGVTAEQIGAEVSGAASAALNEAKAYTDDAISKIDFPDVEVDDTLSLAGYAADSKAVGDRFNNIIGLPTGGEIGQVISKTEDGANWTGVPNKFTHIILIDQNTGYEYLLTMKDGSLTTSIFVISIVVQTLPTKLEYAKDEIFDPTGMVVVANYSDGSTGVIEDYTYSVEDIYGDEVSVTVSYSNIGADLTDAFNVKIGEFEDNLIDFNYMNNGDGTYTLTGWKGTLNGVESTKLIVPDSNKIIV